MTKRTKKILLLCATILLGITTTLGISLAWFSQINNLADPYVGKGSVIRQYFHTGVGTEENPFVITRPIHYYHLVELYQRRSGFATANYYFQLGYDLDNDGALEVYSYDDYGNTDESTSDTLNMAYYSGNLALLPIGTSATPFNGQFDGSFLTISNLNICASETTDETYTTADVGVFGFLGATAIVKDLYLDNTTIDLTDLNIGILNDANVIDEHNSSFHTTTSGTVGYVGYIAGHVNYATTVENVYINNATILGGAAVSSVSNFGYFGAVESSSGQLITSLGDQVSELRNKGGDIGWGNTLSMSDLYSRLYQIARSETGTATPSYSSAETIVQQEVDKDENGNPIYKVVYKYVTQTSTSISGNSYDDLQLRAYQSELGGSYTFNTYNGYNPWIYLTGYTEYQTKTVTTYTLTVDQNKTAYYISDKTGRNFLSVASDLSIVSKNSSEATKWTVEYVSEPNTYKLKTYVGLNSDNADVFYYLTYSGTSLSVVSNSSQATIWETDQNLNNETLFLETGTNNYLFYDGVWKIASVDPTSNITDGNGHYMTISGGKISTTETEGKATDWIISKNSSGLLFKVVLNTINYYLSFGENTGLTISTTPFYWTASPEYVDQVTNVETLSCKDSANRTWYIAYSDGWNAVLKTGTVISFNENSKYYYLGVSRYFNKISNTEESLSPQNYTPKYLELWQMNTSASSTTIEMRHNGILLYLGANTSTGELTVSTTPTTWTKLSDGKYYVTVNGKTYFLTYNNGWRVEVSSKFRLISGTHYITIITNSTDNTYSISDTTVQNDGTSWTIQNDSGSGYIYTTIDGTLYYLSATDSDLGLCLKTNTEELTEGGVIISKAATIWTNSSLGFSTTIDGTEYYITYENGWKLKQAMVTITDGSGNYLSYATDDNGSTYYVKNATVTSSNTYWYKNNNSIWMVQNGTNWYLTFSAENKSPTLSTTINTGWSVSSNSIQTSDGQYFLNRFDEEYNGVTSCVWITHTTQSTFFISTGSVDLYLKGISGFDKSTSSRMYQAHWRFDDSNHLINYYRGNLVYLNVSGYGFAKGTTKSTATKWYQDTDEFNKGFYYIPCETLRRYITYENSAFKVNYKICYTISDGYNYLTLSNDNSSAVNTIGDSGYDEWHLDGSVLQNGGQTTIFQFWNSRPYYLSWNGSSLTISSSSYTWTKDSTGFKNASGQYLSYSYTSMSWSCSQDTYTEYVSDSNKLGINTSGTITNNGTKTKWIVKSNGNIYTSINGTVYYLAIESGSLVTKTSNPNLSWTFVNGAGNNGKLKLTISGIDYYVVYDSNGSLTGNTGWTTATSLYYTIMSGTSDYLTGSASGIGRVTSEASATKWSYNSSSKKFYIVSGSTTYYLTWNETTGFSMTSSGTAFNLTDTNGTLTNITLTYNSNTYYVVYDSTGWNIVSTSGSYIKNNSKYYNVDSSGNIYTNTSSKITLWYFSDSTNHCGNIYTFVNGVIKYLNLNSGKTAVVLSTSAFTWSIENGYLYYTSTRTTTMQYPKKGSGSNTFTLTAVSVTITERYYLYIDSSGNNGITLWNKFYVYALNGTTKYYMYNTSSKTFIDSSTSNKSVFTYTNNNLYCDSRSQYLFNSNSGDSSNGSEIVFGSSSSTSLQFAMYDNHLLCYVGSSYKYVALYTGGSTPKFCCFNIKTTNNTYSYGNTYYSSPSSSVVNKVYLEYATPTTGTAMTFENGSSVTNTFTATKHGANITPSNEYATSSSTSYNKANGTKRYISKGSKSSTMSNLGYKYDYTNVMTITYSGVAGNNASTSPATEGNIDSLTFTSKTIVEPSVTIIKNEKEPTIIQTQTYGDTLSSPTVQSSVKSGTATYIPIRLALQNEDDSSSYYSDYRVHETKNTGYIVSGSNQTSGSYRSDIRVSNYDTGDIYKAFGTGASGSPTYNSTYDSRLQVLTKTAYSANQANANAYASDDTAAGKAGYVRIQDSHNSANINSYYSRYPDAAINYSTLGLTKYTSDDGASRELFAQTLMGSNDVYGLHFMEATISKNHIVVADRVNILGKTYYNYQLPESCIDFNVYERGAVNFFAGTYYSSNVTAFFSLHQIFRDSKNQTITAIKEIEKIYQDSVNGSSKKYIYKYVGEDVTIPSNYSLVFDLAWITNPTGIIQNALYYFEIPLNKGEYALGSVENKIGAYLLYLDIATNGGGDSLSTITAEGTSITNKIIVDTRTSPDTTPYSYMKFAITCPANTSLDDFAFSVKVSFSDTNVTSDYSEGLYTIEIVNKTDSNLKIDVILCDNDDDPENAYPYAYKIIYTNNNVERQTVERIINSGGDEESGLDYWQIAASIILLSNNDGDTYAYEYGYDD